MPHVLFDATSAFSAEVEGTIACSMHDVVLHASDAVVIESGSTIEVDVSGIAQEYCEPSIVLIESEVSVTGRFDVELITNARWMASQALLTTRHKKWC